MTRTASTDRAPLPPIPRPPCARPAGPGPTHPGRGRLGRLLLASALLLTAGHAAAQRPADPAPPAGSSAPAARPAAAASGPPAAAATDDEAIARFKEGRRLLEEGQFDQALVELRASFERLPSPNTELLIGHALRLTNRRADAAMAYRRVIVSAGEKVRGGEERFRPTLEEAGRLEATLRAQLFEVDVVVTSAPPGTTVAIGADPVDVTSDARGATAKVLHEPGTLVVVATAPDGRSATKEIEAQPGGQAAVVIDLPPVPSSEPPPVVQADTGGLDVPPPPLASWVAAGVGATGLVVFGVFGAMSSSAASDLEECSPRCPASLRDTADGGASQQTIANVGLVFGALGLATAGVLWVVWPDDEPAVAGVGPAPSTAPPRAAVRVSPAGRADVLVAF